MLIVSTLDDVLNIHPKDSCKKIQHLSKAKEENILQQKCISSSCEVHFNAPHRLPVNYVVTVYHDNFFLIKFYDNLLISCLLCI